ncbi:tRNA-uridine aminocarboxypropyltransferase 2-like [Liolophura sinensis]|uniref:tRNA-uridine aminocarboxypropyltransferase 2-like n=1 Tax=Liolophura sinensis TaxID=3198878 RepID=UPI0031586EEC
MADFLSELANVEATPRAKRPFCKRCSRPLTVCWCPYLPHEPIDVTTTVWILQHPLEESRVLRTAPILYHSLKPGQCKIFRGKRFTKERHSEVWRTLHDPETLLLYPGPDASDLNSVPSPTLSSPHNLVILDGTWSQAKGLYHQNPSLWNLKKVQIRQSGCSKYVIRSQPTDACLSTLETAAIALSVLEDKPCIQEVLTRPLVALCEFQLQHGAVPHQSKAFQIQAGTYTKALSKSVRKRMAKQQQQQQRKEL